MFESCSRHYFNCLDLRVQLKDFKRCERSSGVEHNLAMVGVASSNLVVRFVSSPFVGDFPYFAGVAELADAQDLKSCEG